MTLTPLQIRSLRAKQQADAQKAVALASEKKQQVDTLGSIKKEVMDLHEPLASQEEHLKVIQDDVQEVGKAVSDLKEPIAQGQKASDFIEFFLRSIKGEKGDTATDEHLVSLIEPLIPEPIQGEPGKDGKDGESIVGPMGPMGPAGKDGQSIVGPPGKDGKDGKDVSELDIKAVIQLLIETIKKDKPLEVTDLRNGQQLMNDRLTGDRLGKRGSGYKLTDQRWHGGGTTQASGSANLYVNTFTTTGGVQVIALTHPPVTVLEADVNGGVIYATTDYTLAGVTFTLLNADTPAGLQGKIAYVY